MTSAYHPVLLQPPGAVVLDLSGEQPQMASSVWSIGKYDELRPGLYTTDLFEGSRHLHVGVDLGGPVGSAVHAFASGTVLFQGYNPADGDYGHVIVTEHRIEGEARWALHGHLSAHSLTQHKVGDRFEAGDVLGWLGAHHENGGWPPHVHFQLSRVRPDTHDMPGAVDPTEREAMLQQFPDPRSVLGPLW
ncbi:MAG: peptidoglycan DD-metalloendopeptidase family protein [Planctomycetota bacterium]|nr:peptidoglycan DD-metalloendopeptidase family protein [Planctomycetota bacterium]